MKHFLLILVLVLVSGFSHAASVVIQSPANGTTTANQIVTVSGYFAPCSGAGLNHLELYLNGRLLYSPATCSLQKQVSLISGSNKITILGIKYNGRVMASATVYVTYQTVATQSSPTPTPTPAPVSSPTASPVASPSPTPAPTAAASPSPSPSPASLACTVTVSTTSALQSAAQSAAPGSTICVAPGTYGAITSTANGTSSAPIRFISTTKWAAKINAGGAAAAWQMNGHWQEVNGFDVTNAARDGIDANGSHEKVLNNRVHDLGAGGCDGTGGAAIGQNSYSNSDLTVAGNLIFNIGPGSGKTLCNSVQGIYFAEPVGFAYNNVISTVSSDCITSWHYASQLVVVNNTVMGCLDAGILIGADATTNSSGVVANNIVVNNPNAGIAEEGSVSGYRYLNNLVYNNGTGFHLLNGAQSGTLTAAPLFLNDTGSAATGNYRLQSTSPAIDHGTSSSAPSADFDGAPRPYDAGYDIGAFEWRP